MHVKWRTTLTLLAFFSNRSNRDDGRERTIATRASIQETHAPSFWVDSSTDLMRGREGQDRDVTWKNAMKYCRDLWLAGSSDRGLASLEGLEGICDKDANTSGLMGPSGKGTAATWHVKGNLFLTGS